LLVRRINNSIVCRISSSAAFQTSEYEDIRAMHLDKVQAEVEAECRARLRRVLIRLLLLGFSPPFNWLLTRSNPVPSSPFPAPTTRNLNDDVSRPLQIFAQLSNCVEVAYLDTAAPSASFLLPIALPVASRGPQRTSVYSTASHHRSCQLLDHARGGRPVLAPRLADTRELGFRYLSAC